MKKITNECLSLFAAILLITSSHLLVRVLLANNWGIFLCPGEIHISQVDWQWSLWEATFPDTVC